MNRYKWLTFRFVAYIKAKWKLNEVHLMYVNIKSIFKRNITENLSSRVLVRQVMHGCAGGPFKLSTPYTYFSQQTSDIKYTIIGRYSYINNDRVQKNAIQKNDSLSNVFLKKLK